MKTGWRAESLGCLCEFHRGLTYAKGDEVEISNNVVLRATNIDFKTNLLDFGELKFIDDTLVVPASKKVKKGSLIICMSSGSKSHLGKVAYIDDDFGYAFGSFMGMITTNEKLLPRYLFHLMTSEAYKTFISKLSDGANINNLKFDDLMKFQVPCPTVADQQRIVGILDKAFEGIAIAKANTEKNLQNASSLFKSHLQSIFTQRGKGWVKKKLEDVCLKIQDGAHQSPQTLYSDGGVGRFLYITSKNIRNNQMDLSKINYVDRDFHDTIYPRCNPEFGDVLLTKDGANTGNVTLNTLAEPFSLLSSVCLIKTNPAKLNSSFLKYYIQSSHGFKQITGKMTGAAIKRIILKTIKAATVPLPELPDQARLVKLFDELLAETQRLESIYFRKLTAIEELKKSLLHQAFNGRLTAEKSIQMPLVAVPYSVTLPNITTTDLHAGILAMAYAQHRVNGKEKYFTHVKAEKIAHMVEAHLGLDLGRVPVKDAAGPNDFPHLKKVEHRARKANYFDFRRDGTAYRVRTLRGFERLIDRTRNALGDRYEEVERLLRWMLPMSAQQAEIAATVFAAWNNLLLDGMRPTDERIVQEARQNWHPDKLKIDRQRFFKAVEWLRKKDVVPKGKGKRVVAKGN